MFGVSGLRLKMLRSGDRGPTLTMIFYAAWSALYLSGHALGAVVVGGMLGMVGSHWPLLPLLPRVTAAISILCLFWAVQEARLSANGWPQWHRQVQRHWLGRLPWTLIALGYGFQLGSAVLTRIKIRTTYAALMIALASGSAVAGATIMLGFGAARALPPLLQGPFVASPDRAIRLAVAIDRFDRTIIRANAALLAFAGLVLAWISLVPYLGTAGS
jgi:sulfite exporter TauE/SafE